MGKIKKILENELIGGTQSTDVYPVTSTQAVYDENNRRLSDFVFDKNDVVQETGTSETKVMSQKSATETFLTEEDIVNNLTDGGADKALSAEMGKTILDTISNIEPIVINGNVTNAADEEDITSEDNLLKFKDRTYVAGTNSGMGYVILRKDKTFAEQVTQANTIYEIRYDFDLGGAEVAIPENCVLKFDGGSIKNGTVNCNKTYITVTSGNILTTLIGTLINTNIPITWFGAKPSTAGTYIDISDNLNIALACSSVTGVTIIIPTGTFYHSGIIMPKGATLQGQNMNTSILALTPTYSTNNAITIVDNDCEISNITVQGNGRNQAYNDVYQDNEGNGICIANGTRFGLDNHDCTNTKIYNIIIQKCGNNGLAIIDRQKWVFSFNNITIKTCGNIGFLDRSSDNSYYGFNISHCENLGMYAEGSRNRYTTFKVFVCGMNRKKAEVSTDETGQTVIRPDGMYWQGVRIKGRHMSFVGFDIQECGAELLFVENYSSNNYIQTTLDRPGFGTVNGVSTVLEYGAYHINGTDNICYFSVLVGDNYPTIKPVFSWNNYIIETIESKHDGYIINKYGYAADTVVEYDTKYVPASLCNVSGALITMSNFTEYLTITDNAATLNKPVAIIPHNKTNVLNTGISFRLYATLGKRYEFYYIYEPYDTLRFLVENSNSGINLGIRYKDDAGTYKEPWVNSRKADMEDIDYIDVYLYANQYSLCMEVKTSDGHICSHKINTKLGYTGYFQQFRFAGVKTSHIHMTDGYVNPCIDIESTYGTHFALTKDVSIAAPAIYALDKSPTEGFPIGFQYFNTTLNKPVWWTGTAWVDSTGAEI